MKTLLRLAAVTLMWGSSFLWIKLALAAFTPVQLVLARVVLGALVLIAICYANRDRLPSDRHTWGHLAVAALTHSALPFVLFAVGEQTVSSSVTGVLNSSTPLWTLLMALLLGTERRPGTLRLAGLLVGIGGVGVIFAPWQASDLMSWGAAACVAAAACYGFAFVYEAKYLSGTGLSPVTLAGTQMLLSSGFLVLAVPVGGIAPIRPDLTAIIAVTVLGVFSTGIGFAISYRLLATEGAVAVSMVGYLMPVVSVLLGTIFLGEELNPRIVAGMAIVLAGVALTRRDGGRRPSETARSDSTTESSEARWTRASQPSSPR